jgi:AcrR family transcriptional regulator
MNRNHPDTAPDARSQRSRQAILGAFFHLVLERRYAAIRIADIVTRSGVGRSTFYEHFRNKDAVLAEALAGPFSALVEATVPDAPMGRLPAMLDHFWQNRQMARGLLVGAMRRRVSAALAQMIEQRHRRDAASTHWPLTACALALAEMMLAPIAAWLSGQVTLRTGDLADGLYRAAQAAARAFWVGADSRPC